MCVSPYRRCVVSKCLQVSDVGVNEPPRVFDLVADILVCSISNEHSQAETHTNSKMTTNHQQSAARLR